MGLLNLFSATLDSYEAFILTLPNVVQDFIKLFILIVLTVIYVFFVWKFSRFVGTKNIFKFNLNQYNKSSNPLFAKLVAGTLYLLEYIFLVPFIIFFWYAIFTLFLFFLVENNIELETILLVSVLAVSAIRVCSYIPKQGEQMAKDIAKILPFTFLGISILNPLIFTNLLSRSIARFNEIPFFISGVLTYLIFIVAIEVILRFFEFFFEIFGWNDSTNKEEQDEEN